MAFSESGDGVLRIGPRKVDPLPMDSNTFLDRSIVLYGASGSGKTVLVKTIMGILRDHVPNILVIAPTEPSNNSYAGYVHPALIHYTLSPKNDDNPGESEQTAAQRFLEMIWERQEMLASTYAQTRNLDILRGIYEHLPSADRKKCSAIFTKINAQERKMVRDIERTHRNQKALCQEKIDKLRDRFNEARVYYFKRVINFRYDILWKASGLTDDQRYTLQHINLNPRLLLIFDDCAAQLKPFFSKELFRKLFYQGRHCFITSILCCQDDSDLIPNLRKNAFISIYTTISVCVTSFGRAEHSKEDKDFVRDTSRKVFEVKYRMMAYSREGVSGQHFFHLKCPIPEKFMFGSPTLLEYCDSIQAKGVKIDTNNSFYSRFRFDR